MQNLTHEQRRAMFIIMKHETENGLAKVQQLVREYKWKVLCEQDRRMKEIGLS